MPVACPYNMFHRRKHIRLRNFDYASANAYFITICVKYFVCVFGEIRNGIMRFSNPGNEAALYLQKIPELHQNFELDEFIVMPNHVHCILAITQNKNETFSFNEYRKLKTGSVSSIINQYKGAVKKWCNDNGFTGFEWQGRFHDHVIRNDREYWRSKNYIINNPANWQRDKFYR